MENICLSDFLADYFFILCFKAKTNVLGMLAIRVAKRVNPEILR
jgi:hypothetical protein